MDNANKALMIAAGMLMTVMVATLLMIGYNSISKQQQAKQTALTEKQISEFNRQFEVYNRDLSGFELLSLLNKVIDYNALNTVSSSDNEWANTNASKAYAEMYVSFSLKNNNTLFEKTTYNSQKKGDKEKLDNILKSMRVLEEKYTSSVMTKLAGLGSSYDPSDTVEIKKALGLKDNDKLFNELPKKEDVEKYSYYIEFKRDKFKIKEKPEYDSTTGRIVKLEYIQDN